MVIRSLLFNIGFWLNTLILGVFGAPFAFFSSSGAFWVAKSWARVTLWLLRVLCGITYEVRGREFIPRQSMLIACKHQSAWDTIVLWVLINHPVFVLKRALIFIPVFGWHLLFLRSIYIDRSAGAAAMKRMLREARERIKDNWSIVIFPEGTRTMPYAETVYHPGVAALYQHLNLSVVPVAVNSGLYWSRNSFIKHPGHITMEFLPHIAPGMKGREFLPLLKEKIEAATTALLNHPPVI